MKKLTSDVVQYSVRFMGRGLELPFPKYQDEHFTYDGTVTGAKRVLAILPQFVNENAGVEQWSPVRLPKEPHKVIAYPAAFDYVKPSLDLKHPSVEVMEGAEQ